MIKLSLLPFDFASISTETKNTYSEMVNTRSQALREKRIEQSEENRFTDDDDKVSVADHYRESYFNENDGETMRTLERDHERLKIVQ